MLKVWIGSLISGYNDDDDEEVCVGVSTVPCTTEEIARRETLKLYQEDWNDWIAAREPEEITDELEPFLVLARELDYDKIESAEPPKNLDTLVFQLELHPTLEITQAIFASQDLEYQYTVYHRIEEMTIIAE